MATKTFEGEVCKKHPEHGRLRYLNGGHCVQCKKDAASLYQKLNPKKHRAKKHMSTETKEYLDIMLEHATRFLKAMREETGMTAINIEADGFVIGLRITDPTALAQTIAELDDQCGFCGEVIVQDEEGKSTHKCKDA